MQLSNDIQTINANIDQQQQLIKKTQRHIKRTKSSKDCEESGLLLTLSIGTILASLKLQGLYKLPVISFGSGAILASGISVTGMMVHAYDAILMNRFYADRKKLITANLDKNEINQTLINKITNGNETRCLGAWLKAVGGIGLALTLPNLYPYSSAGHPTGYQIMAFAAPGMVLGSLHYLLSSHPLVYWNKFGKFKQSFLDCGHVIKNTKNTRSINSSDISDSNGIIEHYSTDYYISGYNTNTDGCFDKERRNVYCVAILPASVIFMIGLGIAAYENNLTASSGNLELLLSIALTGVASIAAMLSADIKFKSNKLNQCEKHLSEISNLQAFNMKTKGNKFIKEQDLMLGSGKTKSTTVKPDVVKTPAVDFKPIKLN